MDVMNDETMEAIEGSLENAASLIENAGYLAVGIGCENMKDEDRKADIKENFENAERVLEDIKTVVEYMKDLQALKKTKPLVNAPPVWNLDTTLHDMWTTHVTCGEKGVTKLIV